MADGDEEAAIQADAALLTFCRASRRLHHGVRHAHGLGLGLAQQSRSARPAARRVLLPPIARPATPVLGVAPCSAWRRWSRASSCSACAARRAQGPCPVEPSAPRAVLAPLGDAFALRLSCAELFPSGAPASRVLDLRRPRLPPARTLASASRPRPPAAAPPDAFGSPGRPARALASAPRARIRHRLVLHRRSRTRVPNHLRIATTSSDLAQFDDLFFNALHGHPFRSPAIEGNLATGARSRSTPRRSCTYCSRCTRWRRVPSAARDADPGDRAERAPCTRCARGATAPGRARCSAWHS